MARPSSLVPGFLVLLACGLAAPARAAWPPDGVPVGAADGVQSGPVAIGDGAGGAIIAWVDQRAVSPGLYAQHVLFNGAMEWSTNGVLLSGVTAVNPPRIVPDGAGGAIVIWPTGAAIQAQRVDAGGALHAGWPADGKVITTDVTGTGDFGAVSDGAGGAYISRHKTTPGCCGFPAQQAVLLTRIDADGNFAPGWTESGTVLRSSDGTTLLALAADPTGGILAATNWWFESGTNPHRGWAEHRQPDSYGSELANPFAGLSSDGVFHAAAASDGTGGSYWSWRGRAGGTDHYYMQRLSAGGIQVWSNNAPFSELVVQDGSNGVWFAGRPAGTNRLEVHRRLTNGTLPTGWTNAGVVISQPTTLGGVAAQGPAGQVLLCWSENTGSGFDLRAIAVAEDATIPAGWSAGGNAVCTAAGDQTSPVLVIQPIDAISCWQDQRAGAANQDIYAMRIEPTGAAAVGPVETPVFGIVGIAPVPARDQVAVRFGWVGDDPVVIEVADVAGRTVLRREAAAGRAEEDLDLGGLGSGLYFLRLVQGGRIATGRFAVVR